MVLAHSMGAKAEVDGARVAERAWIEDLSKADSDHFVALHTEDATVHDPTFPAPLQGRKAIRNWLGGLYAMFPDYHVEKVRSFGNGDWVCLESVISGTMQGPIQGPGGHVVPATGKSFRINACVLCRVQGHEIAEVRTYYDVMGLMAQLGLKA